MSVTRPLPARQDAMRRRILMLCGLDPGTVLAERDARPVPPPQRLPIFEEVLALAADDAARLGDAAARPEHLLVGLLRSNDVFIGLLMAARGVDLARVGVAFAGRLRTAGDRVGGSTPPWHPEAAAVIDAAVAVATERRHDVVHGGHLLLALLRGERNPVIDCLMDVGTDGRAVAEEVARML